MHKLLLLAASALAAVSFGALAQSQSKVPGQATDNDSATRGKGNPTREARPAPAKPRAVPQQQTDNDPAAKGSGKTAKSGKGKARTAAAAQATDNDPATQGKGNPARAAKPGPAKPRTVPQQSSDNDPAKK